MKAIDNKELIIALEELEKEKGIKKEELLESIRTALITAYKRNFDALENVDVKMDEQTGATHVYAIKEVMERANDDALEISLEDARKINKELNLGDSVEVEIVPRDFGRIAAQTAKQVIIQKLRETERNMIFNEYNERKGEIVTGLVQKADNHIVVLDLGKLEGIMLSKDQIPTEHYKVNDKIKAYVVDVERGEKGAPQAIVSRTHPDFVRKLLEFEIPEIYEGLIEIKSVARDPGQRCKVAVYSQNENIDPVGSCVGQKGIRIQNVINELNGEKIDVIEWNPDPSTFLASALLPAQIMAVDIKEEEKFAQVIVQDDQLSLAIGKSGQNVRLAAKLTGWKIDIKTETQFRELLAQKTEETERYIYPIPYEYYKKYGIRKYGFHGTSHMYVSQRLAEIVGKDISELKIVTCHLGQGSSICAVEGGKSVDTSMGLTPLAGIPMVTRSGDLDPSVVTFLMKKEGWTAEEAENMLNKKSGVQGISGLAPDFREIEAASYGDNERAEIAIEKFKYEIASYIAKYAVAMNGVDYIVFTGGVGENQINIRRGICEKLEFMGVKVDVDANNMSGEEKEISTPDSKIKVYVIPTNEELMIAIDTKRLVEGK
mgnify:CR=1 FL=1